MVPEISREGEMPEAACIDDLKAIDVQALLIIFFVILNPDKLAHSH